MVIGDSLVLTEQGFKCADSIVEGDRVLTHFGRYREVLKVRAYWADDAVKVSGRGHSGLVVGATHRFMARRAKDSTRGRTLREDFEFIPAFDTGLRSSYWALPTAFPMVRMPLRPEGVKTHADVADLMAAAGRYLGGCVGYKYPGWLLEHFHNGVPAWLLGAPQAARVNVVSSFLQARGGWNPSRHRFQVRTQDKRLAHGVAALCRSVGFSASVLTTKRGWMLQVFTGASAFAFTEAHDYGRITKVGPVEAPTRLYDFAADEDNSYVADGLVHLGGAVYWGGE